MVDIHTEMIKFPSNEHETPGYLARPAAGSSFPGVVVIQEWWGLNDHIKDVAERFAGAGFVALAPDLYNGEVAAEPDEARKLAMALDRERAIREIKTAGSYLRDLGYVAPKKTGIVGWCMGGGLCLSTAAQDEAVGAAVVFYGRPLEAGDTARLKAPVLGIYGEDDHGIPVSLVRDFESEMNNHKIPNEIHIYPDAPHAFFNDTRAESYRPEAAADAWQRTLDWFREHLA
jgi:carboxymethylenebutenolidase